jgi:hypothetical protein
LILWHSLTHAQGRRTLDLLQQLATSGIVTEKDAQAMYHCLQTDELHNLGGPAWAPLGNPESSAQASQSGTH